MTIKQLGPGGPFIGASAAVSEVVHTPAGTQFVITLHNATFAPGEVPIYVEGRKDGVFLRYLAHKGAVVTAEVQQQIDSLEHIKRRAEPRCEAGVRYGRQCRRRAAWKILEPGVTDTFRCTQHAKGFALEMLERVVPLRMK